MRPDAGLGQYERLPALTARRVNMLPKIEQQLRRLAGTEGFPVAAAIASAKSRIGVGIATTVRLNIDFNPVPC